MPFAWKEREHFVLDALNNIELNNIEITPRNVRPGQSVRVRFAVRVIDANTPVPLVEVREGRRVRFAHRYQSGSHQVTFRIATDDPTDVTFWATFQNGERRLAEPTFVGIEEPERCVWHNAPLQVLEHRLREALVPLLEDLQSHPRVREVRPLSISTNPFNGIHINASFRVHVEDWFDSDGRIDVWIRSWASAGEVEHQIPRTIIIEMPPALPPWKRQEASALIAGATAEMRRRLAELDLDGLADGLFAEFLAGLAISRHVLWDIDYNQAGLRLKVCPQSSGAPPQIDESPFMPPVTPGDETKVHRHNWD